MKFLSASLRLCGLILLTAIAALSQVPAPKDVIGFTPGDDRKLASWASIVEYFKKLDAASDRVMFEEIGKTTMDRPFVYATISSPENLRNLEKYKRINADLADPRRITGGNPTGREGAAKRLIAQGKTIVMITCGIHSTEVGSTLSSMLIAHQLASSNHPDIKKILDNTIILLVPSLNPDGVDIVKNWYDKTLGTKFEGTDPPELYHKYVGHDNNRDWYAFTQVETQLTVDKIHNVWHPQIVHDIHQQGENGSRLFLPPYMQPVEPNVPKQIVEGYTELGNFMATTMRKMGYQGITTDSTYDAWTPSRAYSHYHGGVRILSETASADLATPVKIKWEDLRPGQGYDPKKETPNFGPAWKGGEWKLSNITDYMTTAAFLLMNHAADNRERWLSRFYEIGKEAVRPRKEGELVAYLMEFGKGDGSRLPHFFSGYWSGNLFEVLEKAGVQVISEHLPFSIDGRAYDKWTIIVPMDQPYSSFAKAMIESDIYPDLRDGIGNPIPPYDVTAHSISLLFNVPLERVYKPFSYKGPKPTKEGASGSSSDSGPCDGQLRYRTYRSNVPAMDEGWTRWVVKEYGYLARVVAKRNLCAVDHDSISDADFKKRIESVDTIIFPDQSPNQILNGYAKGSMPDEYTGGVGKEGVENLRKFVEAGGTLVFLNRASNFAIEQFNLPVRDVTKGSARKDFYVPGSILRTELDTTHPIAKDMPAESIAWFENGPAFEIARVTPSGVTPVGDSSTLVTPEGVTLTYRIIATYPKDPKQILLSGWALGAEKIAGKAALIEFTIGKGKIILFGFRPQYRGQSLATFPLFFNAIAQ